MRSLQLPLSTSQSATRPRVLLVDVVGELGAWWGTAQIAFVGGSMGSRGGQNMIEPAAYGAAVSFGPNTWNFRDIVAAMLAHDAAVVVRDGEQFTAVRPPLPGGARVRRRARPAGPGVRADRNSARRSGRCRLLSGQLVR